MERFFLWLSGADTTLIARCRLLNRTERLRFSGLGALVLLPGVLGAFSMSYAVSTVAHKLPVAIGLGLCWGVMVVVIDRYLVSTLYKSAFGSKAGRVVSISVRYIFAVFVGIAVSHPLVMLWFDKSITQQITENRRAAIEQRRDEAKQEIAELPKIEVAGTAGSLTASLDQKNELRNCLINLQTAEQAGVQTTLPCGSSSGKPECSTRCETIGTQIATLTTEIDDLQAKISSGSDRTALLEIQAQDLRRKDEAKIKRAAEDDVRDIRKQFSSDYLARVDALHQLGEKHADVKTVTMFMILFFVFVDIVPVTMKLVTPKGEYEEIRDSLILERRERERAKQRLALAGTPFEATFAAQARAAVFEAEVHSDVEMVKNAVEALNGDLEEFQTGMNKAAHTARRNHRMAEMVDRHGSSLLGSLDAAWAKLSHRLRAHMEE